MIIIFNWLGLGMFVLAMVIAAFISKLANYPSEELALMIGGPLAMLFDLLYRCANPTGHWLHPDRGGSLFFLPVWLWGLVLLISGAMQMSGGHAGDLIYGVFGIAVIAIVLIPLVLLFGGARKKDLKPAGDPWANLAASRPWVPGKAESNALSAKADDKDLCYLCGKSLARDERASRVCQECRA